MKYYYIKDIIEEKSNITFNDIWVSETGSNMPKEIKLIIYSSFAAIPFILLLFTFRETGFYNLSLEKFILAYLTLLYSTVKMLLNIFFFFGGGAFCYCVYKYLTVKLAIRRAKASKNISNDTELVGWYMQKALGIVGFALYGIIITSFLVTISLFEHNTKVGEHYAKKIEDSEEY